MMKLYYWIIFLCLLIFPLLLNGQSRTVPLNNSFKFRDGIYLDYEQFRQNEPAFFWEDIVGDMVSTQSGSMRIASLILGDAEEGEVIPLDKVWGFSRNGSPFIQIPRDSGDLRQFGSFVALRLVGKICLFNYEKEMEYKVSVKAYNPLNGRPFREGKVTQTEMITVEKLLYFPSGEIAPLNRASLVNWMKDDPDLLQAYLDKERGQVQINAYEWLEEYNERNRVYTLK